MNKKTAEIAKRIMSDDFLDDFEKSYLAKKEEMERLCCAETFDLVDKFQLQGTDEIFIESDIMADLNRPHFSRGQPIRKIVNNGVVISKFLNCLRHTKALKNVVEGPVNYSMTFYGNGLEIFNLRINTQPIGRFIRFSENLGRVPPANFYVLLKEILESNKWDAKDNLAFSIYADKRRYSLGERITLKATLKNIGTQPALIHHFLCLTGRSWGEWGGGVCPKIMDPADNLLRYDSSMIFMESSWPFGAEWFLTLKPGAGFAGNIYDPRDGTLCIKEKGVYKIQCYYLSHVDAKASIWRGTVLSNVIQINIV
ncbi:MAG: hypothetical protein V1676_01115 [Candidatus Diapherotrites archaeon]